MLNREINWSSLTTMLDSVLRDWSKTSLHTAMPGLIDSYDAATRRARVRPALRLVMAGEMPGEDGEAVERALAVNVPVMWMAGGGYSALLPLDPGDRGMLLFSERGMTEFKTTGALSTPDKSRYFSESDAVFMPCDFGIEVATPASETAAAIQTLDGVRSVLVDTDRVELRCGGTRVTATSSGIELNCSGTVAIESGGLTHNGKNVGATHMHSGVLPGGATTGPPV